MPSDIVNNWLNGRKYAQIDSLRLKPREHPTAGGTPLSAQRGQAEAFYLRSENNEFWIAKKFYPNKCPDTDYLNAIGSILPQHKAFRCGTERRVLTSASLKKVTGSYYSKQLADWLENVVLMPQIGGFDWASMTERIRDREVFLSEIERSALCVNLATAVKEMEACSISHRDLSNGNIFVNPRSFEVSLIDFDSLFHPDLPMPAYTTAGSEGYTAPFVEPGDAQSTYCNLADRFALAVLCVEFLILTAESPFYHEGGVFSQEDIDRRNGATVDYAERELRKACPDALELFRRALSAGTFQDCPSPDDWIAIFRDFGCCLSVDDLPEVSFALIETVPVACVALPDNPWNN